MAHPTKKPMVSAVFRDRFDAQEAFDRLVDRGYANSEINILMSDATRHTFFANERQSRFKVGSHASECMGIGGAIGTAVGATLGAVMGVGTSLILPSFGVAIAGP